MQFNLREDLKKRCPLFEGMSDAELLRAAIDPTSTYMYFIGHEVTPEFVFYKYECPVCEEVHEEAMERHPDFLYIGSCPSDENPYPEYSSAQTCAALMVQLKNTFGKEPKGAQLRMKFEPGSDGYEVICGFSPVYPESLAYALTLEGSLPEKWSDAAIRTLEELTGQPYVSQSNWTRFWFDSNMIWGYVDNRERWLHIKKTLRDNGHESDPLDCRANCTHAKIMKFGYYTEYNQAPTLREFFRINGMKP